MRTIITAACLVLLASAWAQQEKRTTSAMPSGKAVLEAYVSAWNRHDFAALDKLLTPDAVHEDIAWPSRDEGPAQIKKFMQEMIALEPDFDWRLTRIIDSGSPGCTRQDAVLR
jgi:ketosteroid isomerase-like protein